MKKVLLGSLGGVLALFIGLSPVLAAEFAGPSKDGNGNVTLGTSETHKNMYTAGGSVTVNSTIQGDLFVAGGTVTVDGAVEQDVTIAGGTLVLNSPVGGDIRAFGGTVTINAAVGGDVITGGGSVTLSEKASVGGDVVAMGGSVEVHSPVAGFVRAMSDNVIINSKINGTVTVDGGKTVVFGSRADVGGKVTVRAQNDPQVKDGARLGTIDFTKRAGHSKKGLAAVATTDLLIKFLAYVIVGLLAVYLWPRKTRIVVEAVRHKMLANTLTGLVTVIAAPILAILLLITFIGYYVALLVLAAFLLLMLSACIYAFLFLGAWVIQQLTKKPDLRLDWQAVVVGVVIFMLLGFIPVLGWIVKAIIALAAVGGLLRVAHAHMKEEKVEVQ